MLNIALLLGIFWLIQATVSVGFKLSSDQPQRFWLWFCAAHAIGVPSLWLLVQVYKHMNPAVAFGLGMGGAFLASQIALFVVFRPPVSLTQWLGVLAICGGMMMLAMGGAGEAEPAPIPEVAIASEG